MSAVMTPAASLASNLPAKPAPSLLAPKPAPTAGSTPLIAAQTTAPASTVQAAMNRPVPGTPKIAKVNSNPSSKPAANPPVPQKSEKPKRDCNPFSKPSVDDGRYENFVHDKLGEYPRGYPSMAANISADIDGRVYRRFSYARNRLLLWYQDQIVCLENDLKELDKEDFRKGNEGDAEARQRLISRRFDERYRTVRKEALENLEATLEKYDNLLLREHEIMSIKKAPAKMHKAMFDFMWDGKKDADGKRRKHLLPSEYQFMYRTDDFMILGNQDDAWLGSFAESVKYLLPKKIRRTLLASKEDREKNAGLTNTTFLTNDRIDTFVKGTVCAANTVLLVVPIVILYAMSIDGASGWLKIGVLLIFVVIFAFLLAALTNASRNDLLAGSAGYCAVLIVFLTYSGP